MDYMIERLKAMRIRLTDIDNILSEGKGLPGIMRTSTNSTKMITSNVASAMPIRFTMYLSISAADPFQAFEDDKGLRAAGRDRPL